jgi:purine nucleosidase
MLNIPCLRSTWVDAAMRDRQAYVASNERQQAAVAGGATTVAISPEDEATGGHKALADLVCSSDRPVSIVVTGPLTNVAWALRERGEAFARNVREVIIMGGAVDVKGNVFDMFLPRDRTGVAGSAEWNIYWDAPAAKAVIESPLLRGKVLLFSLDATNHVPVTPEFVSHFGRVVFDPTATAPPRGVILPAAATTSEPGIPIFAAAQPTLLSQFVGASWTTCTWLELLHGSENGYYAWDALTAAYLVDPDVVEFVPTPLTVVAESTDPHEGRTARVAPDAAVAAAHVACRVSAPRFNQMMLELCTYT